MQLSLPFDAAPILPRIRERLLAAYRARRDTDRLEPTSEFVKAMLAQRGPDAAADEAFRKLRAQFPSSWDGLPDAEPAALLPSLAGLTYASDKAVRLVDCARLIRERRGRFDLAFLETWTAEQAMGFLQRLGIGPDVAAATLNLSSLRKRVFAADTQVLRIAFRLGLVPSPRGSAREHRLMASRMPDNYDADDLYELHWLMKAHGEARCRQGQPDCSTCPLASLCAHHNGGAAVLEVVAEEETPKHLETEARPAVPPVAPSTAPYESAAASPPAAKPVSLRRRTPAGHELKKHRPPRIRVDEADHFSAA